METEEERRIRHRERIEKMQREKKKTQWMHRLGMAAVVAAAVSLGGGVGIAGAGFIHRGSEQAAPSDGEEAEAGSQQTAAVYGEGADAGSRHTASIDGERADAGSRQTAAADGEGADAGNRQSGIDSGNVSTGSEEPGENGNEEAKSAGSEDNRVVKEAHYGLGGGVEAALQGEQQPVIAGSVVLPQMFRESIEEAPLPMGQTAQGEGAIYEAHVTEETVSFAEEIVSKYGVLIDMESGDILAAREAYERMNPASMTKILTVLVAAEHLTEADLEETAAITIDITDYCFVNDCSVTGYERDETVTVRDLFYGTILPSGADSALALAIYVAGSQEAFVELMNGKLEELGLAETSHFTNCVGLYDEEHYSTAYDMAMILKAAVDNEFCREVLSAHTYTTSPTEQHPEGLVISNWFLRRIEDRDTHGEVLCGKTGYVVQSGSCAASLSRGHDGREYLCVTAGSDSQWKCIADQVGLYERFLPES